MSYDDVKAAALALSDEERELLSTELHLAGGSERDAPPGPSWDEIQNRVRLAEAGKLPSRPAEEFLDELAAEVERRLAART